MMAFRPLRISVRHFTKRFAEQTNAGGLRYDDRYSLSRFLVLCVPPSDHFLQLREEWGYPYWVTTDAGSADLLITLHGTCETRECAAKTTLENSFSGEMGGGTYTYLTLVGTFRTNPAPCLSCPWLITDVADQVKAGLVDESVIDQVVSTLLRVKFELGLFESKFTLSSDLSWAQFSMMWLLQIHILMTTMHQLSALQALEMFSTRVNWNQ